MGDDVLVPFQLFTSELASDDVTVRTRTILKIEYIVALMEPNDILNEMIPMLTGNFFLI